MPGDTTIFKQNQSDSIQLIDTFKSKQIVIIQPQKESKRVLGLEIDLWSIFLIPIILFSLGLFTNTIVQKLKIRKTLKLNQDFLFSWIDLIEIQIIKQFDGLHEFSTKLTSVDNIPLEFKSYDLHIDKLKYIDSPTLISIFVTNKKGDLKTKNKLLFDLENKISFLQDKYDSVFETFEIHKKISTINSDDWQTYFINTHNTIRAIIESAEKENIYYQKILQIYSDWTHSNTAKTSKIAAKKLFIDKAENECQLCIASQKNSKIAFDLLANLQMLALIYERIEATYNLTSERLKENADNIKSEYYKLKEIKSELAKLKTKPLLFLK